MQYNQPSVKVIFKFIKFLALQIGHSNDSNSFQFCQESKSFESKRDIQVTNLEFVVA